MSDETAIEKSGISFETRILVIGSLIGALVGLAGSFLLVKNNERKGTDLQITTGEGVKLSLIIMTLLRQVADL
ncbi:MAG: hypothetical protein ABUK20_13710 [Anaerolineales bacterium]|jgi:hypothetical protein